ncbi:MAG: universal stress protein [Betaproteobacteria bacterium]|nr:universal stress protein [Betaproteobacteria bacterium]
MGARGMGALKSLLLGSVATKVVGSADVPVPLVKGGPRSRGLARGGLPKAERPVPIPGLRGGDALGRSRSGVRAAWSRRVFRSERPSCMGCRSHPAAPARGVVLRGRPRAARA